MQNQIEIAKINHFLSATLPIVVWLAKTFLQSAGLDVEEKDCGFDITFHIKSGEREADFLFHNLLLEIATVDRDETPLRFDERLHDPEYFLAKAARLTHSKLRILFQLLATDNVEEAMENLTRDASQYERLRIWKFDQKPP